MSSLTSLELTRVDNVGRDILDIQSYLVHSDSKMSMMRCFFFAIFSIHFVHGCFSVKYLQPFGPDQLILFGLVWPLLPLRGN